MRNDNHDLKTEDGRQMTEDPVLPCSLKETVLMLSGSVIGRIGLIAAICWSRCFANFLFNN